MKNYEKQLIAELLEMASDKFSNHGCNDFVLTDFVTPEIARELAIAMEEANGDEEHLKELQELPVGHAEFKYSTDWCLMSYFSNKILEE